MPFDSSKVEEKIGKIEAKISRLEEKIHNLNQIRNQLKMIIDRKDFERNPDGSIKFDEFGQRIEVTIPAKDEYTGEDLTEARKIAIRDALYAKESTIGVLDDTP